MNKQFKILALAAGAVFFGGQAHALDRKPASGTKTKVVYEKKTTMDFEEANVDGQFMSPEGMGVKADRNLDFDSLLDPKANFKKELNRSSGSVR